MTTIAVATRKGLFSIERRGARWAVARAAFLGDPVTMVLAHSASHAWYACLKHGHFGAKVQRSLDDGSTWEERGTPTYPEKPEGEDDRDPVRGTPVRWSLEQIWSLEAGGSDDELWCGTIPGGLFHSTDAGATWNLVTSLWNDPRRKHWFGGGYDAPGIHSICVDPRDARRITLGVSCGGVWVTEDAGASWALRADGMWAAYMPPERKHDPGIQDPHRIVQCAAAPECLWSQHHNAVFRSTDGARSWREVETAVPSRFGFAVAVHPREADVAWLVPATADEKRIPVDGRLVVARTRDGGGHFDVLGNGLPNVHAYHLVYRHGLDVDSSGNVLAMGSTTGGLWISEDQGDSWQTVSTDLPPIYAVRFAR